ncbi:uncharacterized protein LOC131858892 [Cryptomeria japonica]|uniref:uncharacterized protein LOC131858892 n=1 Tax=Cryptomeria japonica TaxID=3369 RepID=UPI0027DA4B44|nr:uncharacterized protein LOC131858892 [Cryptomeria japonica]
MYPCIPNEVLSAAEPWFYPASPPLLIPQCFFTSAIDCTEVVYGVKAGAKAAAIAFVASAIPVLMGARAIPWARANLNYAAQAHIISLVEQPISLWQIKLFWPLPGKTHSKNWVPWKHRSKWQE